MNINFKDSNTKKVCHKKNNFYKIFDPGGTDINTYIFEIKLRNNYLKNINREVDYFYNILFFSSLLLGRVNNQLFTRRFGNSLSPLYNFLKAKLRIFPTVKPFVVIKIIQIFSFNIFKFFKFYSFFLYLLINVFLFNFNYLFFKKSLFILNILFFFLFYFSFIFLLF